MTAPRDFMLLALKQAERGRGHVSPNPLVGAVIVQDGQVVGRGAHLRVGEAHAEVNALRQAATRARGAVLYVTLEPCCFHGRTPPCTLAVLDAGVRRVECAMLDPDPRVAGRGVQQLRDAGVEVEVGLCAAAAAAQNRAYIKHRQAGLPWITLKLAQSLDGRIATTSGDSRWLTGLAARRHVHRTRSRVDAVMVGANTVLADDPQLTVRHVRGRDPRPIVVDGRLRLPLTAQVLRRPGAVVITATDSPAATRQQLAAAGVELWVLPGTQGRVDLRAAMVRAAQCGITSVLLEGGGQLAAAALGQQLVDEVQIYLAPLLLGTGIAAIGEMGIQQVGAAVRLRDPGIRRLGDDLLYTAKVEYPCSPA